MWITDEELESGLQNFVRGHEGDVEAGDTWEWALLQADGALVEQLRTLPWTLLETWAARA